MLGWAYLPCHCAYRSGSGFGGIAGSAAWIAQVLFVLFIVLFLVSFVFRGRPQGPKGVGQGVFRWLEVTKPRR